MMQLIFLNRLKVVKSVVLATLVFSLTSCDKHYKSDELNEGKYSFECIIHNNFTNQTDTIKRMCIGPHNKGDEFWFSIYQEANEDYYKCWIEESGDFSKLSFYHRNPLLSFDAYYSESEYKKDTLNLSFSTDNDSLQGTLNLIRVQ